MATPVAYVSPLNSGKSTRVLYHHRNEKARRVDSSQKKRTVQAVAPIQHPRGHYLPKLEAGERWMPLPENIPSHYYKFYILTREELADFEFVRLGPFDSLEEVAETNRKRFMNLNEIILPGPEIDFIPQNIHLWQQRPSEWVPLNV